MKLRPSSPCVWFCGKMHFAVNSKQFNENCAQHMCDLFRC